MECLSQYCRQVGPSEGSTNFFITCSYGKNLYQDEKLLPVIQAINYFEQSMDIFILVSSKKTVIWLLFQPEQRKMFT